MDKQVDTLYSSEDSLKEDVAESIQKNSTKNLLSINQVVMMLPSRNGAQAIVTTMVYEDRTP